MVGFVALALADGCTPASPDAPAPVVTPSARAAVNRDLAGDLLGALKLVRQEYRNAVASGGGTVTDATEYAETELFAEQAERKAVTWRAAGGLADVAQADELARRLAAIRGAVGRKAPHAAVVEETTAVIAIVQQAMAGAVPESIRGVLLATARADQAIQAEEIAGDYRIGLVSDRAQPIFVRSGESLVSAAAAPADAAYVAVLLRERRTKRPLSGADVDLVVEGQGTRIEARLAELWGDLHQYGANIALPADGAVTIMVRVAPPAYARHGDTLNVFVAPETVTFRGHVRGRELAFDAKAVMPVDQDYGVGDDMLQAIAEAGELHDTGGYRVGLIVEGPEPIWQWKDGKPVLEPVPADATNHVEVVLVDRESGQLVPRAGIDLVFLANGNEVGRAILTPLLSAFSHYGRTIVVPRSATSVRIHVHPPAIGALGRPRLADPADVELRLPAQRKES
ncbi:MAG: hypothetical protein IT293_16320 [Deltaproteobacteria bacterium]|nr:hypothetical protein [Deltaproteobacteria bacterium]